MDGPAGHAPPAWVVRRPSQPRRCVTVVSGLGDQAPRRVGRRRCRRPPGPPPHPEPEPPPGRHRSTWIGPEPAGRHTCRRICPGCARMRPSVRADAPGPRNPPAGARPRRSQRPGRQGPRRRSVPSTWLRHGERLLGEGCAAIGRAFGCDASTGPRGPQSPERGCGHGTRPARGSAVDAVRLVGRRLQLLRPPERAARGAEQHQTGHHEHAEERVQLRDLR